MDLRTYDEVDPEAVAWLNRVALGYDLSPARVTKARRLDPRVPPEFAWYTCEDGRPVAQVAYLLLPVRTTKGREIAGGIAAVCTLPEAIRRGHAQTLMRHIHALLRERGVDLGILATGRARVAYGMYGSLGYQDLVRFRLACGRLPPWRGRSLRARPLRASDRDGIHRAFERRVRGALGFVERPGNLVGLREAWGDVAPKEVRALLRDGRMEGYAWCRRGPPLEIEELVAPSARRLAWTARVSRGKEFSMLLSPRDPAGPFEVAELQVLESWGVLMAVDLTGRRSARGLRRLLGVDEGRFEALALDLF